MGTTLNFKRSSTYHPQTETEIVNISLETYLLGSVGAFSHNTSPHLSTKMTPFRVFYGRDLPHVLCLGRGHTPVDSLEELLKDRDAILEDLHFHLMRA